MYRFVEFLPNSCMNIKTNNTGTYIEINSVGTEHLCYCNANGCYYHGIDAPAPIADVSYIIYSSLMYDGDVNNNYTINCGAMYGGCYLETINIYMNSNDILYLNIHNSNRFTINNNTVQCSGSLGCYRNCLCAGYMGVDIITSGQNVISDPTPLNTPSYTATPLSNTPSYTATISPYTQSNTCSHHVTYSMSPSITSDTVTSNAYTAFIDITLLVVGFLVVFLTAVIISIVLCIYCYVGKSDIVSNTYNINDVHDDTDTYEL